MGIIRTEIELRNPVDPSVTPMTVTALADTGALHLCLPDHVVIQMGYKELEKREVTRAKGQRQSVSYVGPVEIRFRNRGSFTGAMVLGEEPLLGAIPMEDMDLVVVPARQTVDVNPDYPNIPGSIAK